MNYAGRVFPPWLLTGIIGLVTGFGAAGSAAIPFATGAIAQRAGIESLMPIMIGMLGILFILWGLIQGTQRDVRKERSAEPSTAGESITEKS